MRTSLLPIVAMLGLCVAVLPVAIAANQDAGDTLPRLPGALTFGPATVWSQGSTTDWVFHPLSNPMPSDDIVSVRVDMSLDQDTGNCSARPALRYGSDGVNWDPSKEITAVFVNAPNVDFGGNYIDLTQLAGTTPKALVQFGVQVRNQSGGAIEFCNAQLRVQIKRT